MDTLPKKTNPPSDQVLLRVQEILCSGPLSIIPGKPPKEPHPRHRSLPSEWGGLHGTFEILCEVKARREDIHIVVCLQHNSRAVSQTYAFPRDARVPV